VPCGYPAAMIGDRSESQEPGVDRPFDREDARRSARSRGETLDQLLDRNLAELLQELRVAITGVQILFAFLLGLAFTQRFTGLNGFDLTLYTIALLCTALATILLIAPVSFHRLVFRRRQKAALIVVADRLLMSGLALLVLAISSAVMLILDVALGRWAGVIGGVGTAVVAGLTWYVLPLWARRTRVGSAPASPGSTEDPAG
jgi:O-antigen/teichoic acid export membrane protein